MAHIVFRRCLVEDGPGMITSHGHEQVPEELWVSLGFTHYESPIPRQKSATRWKIWLGNSAVQRAIFAELQQHDHSCELLLSGDIPQLHATPFNPWWALLDKTAHRVVGLNGTHVTVQLAVIGCSYKGQRLATYTFCQSRWKQIVEQGDKVWLKEDDQGQLVFPVQIAPEALATDSGGS